MTEFPLHDFVIPFIHVANIEEIINVNFDFSNLKLEVSCEYELYKEVNVKNYLNWRYESCLQNIKYVKNFVVNKYNKTKTCNTVCFKIFYILDLELIGNEFKNGCFNPLYRKGIVNDLNWIIDNCKLQTVTTEIILNPCKYKIKSRTGLLYSYQEQNVEWMEKIENTPNVQIHENNSVKLIDEVYYNGTYFGKNTDKNIDIEVYGGGLFDEMGCGKTACAITLVTRNLLPYYDIENRMITLGRICSRATLVIVPAHIVKQWAGEIVKFNSSNKKLKIVTLSCKIEYLEKNNYDDYINADFVIVSQQFFTNTTFINELHCVVSNYYGEKYKTFVKLDTNSRNAVNNTYKEQGNIIKEYARLYQFYWNRIIIDEFQEILSKNNWPFIDFIKGHHKWLLSGTPFSDRRYIPPFISNNDDMNILYNLNLFRRNTIKSTIAETLLDKFKVNEKVIWIDFTIQERAIYESQSTRNLTFIRQFCCSPFDTEFSMTCKTFDEIIELLTKKNAKDIVILVKNVQAYSQQIYGLEQNMIGIEDENIVAQVQRHLNVNKNQLKNFERDLVNARATESYYKNLEEIITTTDDVECSICMCDIESMTITRCGHVFCTGCIAMVANNKCPTCTAPYKKTELVIVNNEKNESEDPEADYKKYGSKVRVIIKWIIKTLETPENNIIIFMEWEPVMSSIKTILANIGISSEICKGNKPTREKAISRFNASEGRIIMLCSNYASHGTNLTKANKIAIINPIGGTPAFREDIENQAIARAKRIGQKRDIDVVRFVIKNTIEEDLYKESLNKNGPEHEIIVIN